MNEDTSRVLSSYDRTIGRRGFVERFYEKLLATRPEIAELFDETDFIRQQQLLKKGLKMAILFADGDDEAQQHLAQIRETHNHENMQIRPEYYIHWLNSLIATVAEFDQHFDSELEGSWRRTLQCSIDEIKAGY